MRDDGAKVQRTARRPPIRIVRDQRVCGGEPIVAGTRVPVRSVVVQWHQYRNIERVRSAFPRLNAESIAGALAFYEDNRAEIDQWIEESEQAATSPD